MSDSVERRELSFSNLDEVVAEADQLAQGEVRTTGNHTFGQILEHLALGNDITTGKAVGPKPPFFMRLIMPLMKGMVINTKPLKPGVKLPASSEEFFWPKDVSVEDGLAHLKASVEYYKSNGALQKHPFFGSLTTQEALDLNCRHAALHLSFVHPAS